MCGVVCIPLKGQSRDEVQPKVLAGACEFLLGVVHLSVPMQNRTQVLVAYVAKTFCLSELPKATEEVAAVPVVAVELAGNEYSREEEASSAAAARASCG